MKKILLTLVIVCNVITIILIALQPSLNILFVNAFKVIALLIYTVAIVIGINELHMSEKIEWIPTYFNPEVCRKCGYKLCICHLYPPPTEKPKISDSLTVEILSEDFKKNNNNA